MNSNSEDLAADIQVSRGRNLYKAKTVQSSTPSA
jgi:hypothetical protein